MSTFETLLEKRINRLYDKFARLDAEWTPAAGQEKRTTNNKHSAQQCRFACPSEFDSEWANGVYHEEKKTVQDRCRTLLRQAVLISRVRDWQRIGMLRALVTYCNSPQHFVRFISGSFPTGPWGIRARRRALDAEVKKVFKGTMKPSTMLRQLLPR